MSDNPRKQHGVYINDSELLARIAELEAELAEMNSHGPEGHNVTNQQYVDERDRAERAEAERDDYKAVAIDAAKDQARLTAELAALSARCCEGCAWVRNFGSAEYIQCGLDNRYLPPGYACSCWAEREKV